MPDASQYGSVRANRLDLRRQRSPGQRVRDSGVRDSPILPCQGGCDVDVPVMTAEGGCREAMAGLVLVPAGALSDRQLAQVRVIYESAFGAGLRVPFAELTVAGDADRTFVALDGPDAAGFAVLRLLGSVRWTFLRYFAIAGERRSQGLGRQFWQLLGRSLAEDSWPARIVFEVEDPGEPGAGDAERLIRRRRIDFWKACGTRLLPVSGYVLPDYTGSGMTEPMLLMAGAAATTPLPHGDQLRSLVLAIYTDRYRLPRSHPLVVQALASVAEVPG